MKEEIITHVKVWFRENRPDLKGTDIEPLAMVVYQDVQTDIQELERGARIIFVEQFLNQNYLKSAYNLVKDVFQEYYPQEFSDYQKTPIFFEINDDILILCLKEKIFREYNQIFDELEFNNFDLRNKIKNCISQII